jgi:hypothetical protein
MPLIRRENTRVIGSIFTLLSPRLRSAGDLATSRLNPCLACRNNADQGAQPCEDAARTNQRPCRKAPTAARQNVEPSHPVVRVFRNRNWQFEFASLRQPVAPVPDSPHPCEKFSCLRAVFSIIANQRDMRYRPSSALYRRFSLRRDRPVRFAGGSSCKFRRTSCAPQVARLDPESVSERAGCQILAKPIRARFA